jgi:(p)ppGpp synthase/HD superfamily hydrolase
MTTQHNEDPSHWLRLTRYTDCPLRIDLQPGCENCTECLYYRGQEGYNTGQEWLKITSCSAYWTGPLMVAEKVHEGQFRNDDKTPYIEHPKAVASMLEDYDNVYIAVALVHDVFEDGDDEVIDKILEEYPLPPDVLDAAKLLAKPADESYEHYLTLVAKNEVAKIVKIADIIHNLNDSPSKRQIRKYSSALKYLLYGIT